MTEASIKSIILSRRLPKDELDSFWLNLPGILPIGLLLMFFLWLLFDVEIALKLLVSLPLLVLMALFSYTIYAKLKERNLKLIATGLNKEDNDLLIRLISKRENWAKQTNFDYFHAFNLPFYFAHYGFTLTLIPIEQGILINFRNRGSNKGRAPFMWGIETWKQKKIEAMIEKYLLEEFTQTLISDI
jgi:hypothetical protein